MTSAAHLLPFASDPLLSVGVLVPVVQVGIVSMPVPQRRMPMVMAVRLSDRFFGSMLMLMMGVVNVPMFVVQRIMLMLVFMRF